MVHLQYFKETEFREWAPQMSARLVVMLDVLRHQSNTPLRLSPHPKALGRNLGPILESEHNVDHWGEVLAVDVFAAMVHNRRQAGDFIYAARHVGFTGIGIYPEWTNADGNKQVGFHLGVRPTRSMDDPAEWGFVGGNMVTLNSALNAVPAR